MGAYDASRFSPPAPVANVEIRDPKSGKSVPNVLMLLDSGADITLVSAAAVNRLQISQEASELFELVGFDGTRSTAPAVELELVFDGLTFRGRFAVVDQPEGVLGRNILNHLHLGLNGPQLSWARIIS